MLKIKSKVLIFLGLFVGTVIASPDSRFRPEPVDAAEARAVVEAVVLRAYESTLGANTHDEALLTNAPISGETNKRGRHLLSFAAFNQFPKLAQWGLEHSADINLGDKDHANMLRMALGNYNEEMARFALEHGANPNLLMGAGNDTMLSGLVKWEWPVSGFLLAKEFGARPRSEKERQVVIAYLKKLLENGKNVSLWQHLLDWLHWRGDLHLATHYIKEAPLILGELPSAGSGAVISTNMTDAMDEQIAQAISSGEISEQVMENFWVKGKGFEAFLTFNGFTDSLVKRLSTLEHTKAVKVVKTQDFEGNDLLAAAIKSLNDEAVEAILDVSSETVNRMVPLGRFHYSTGQRPLHMAVQWEAPYRIFELLITHGANPNLTNGSGTTATRLLDYYRNDWDEKRPGEFQWVRELFEGNR